MNSESTSTTDKPKLAIDPNQLSVERTVMAADRSLMAWVRTALSLISFGFTIYKFLEYARPEVTNKVIENDSSPKAIGLYLIGVGILCLIFGNIENVKTIKNLQKHFVISRPHYSLIMSGFVALFGIVLFLSILYRMIII